MHWLAFEMGDSKIDVLEGGEQKYFTILLHFRRDIKQDVMIVMCLHIINHRNNNIKKYYECYFEILKFYDMYMSQVPRQN